MENFPEKKSINEYLSQLSGAEDYVRSCRAEDEDDFELMNFHMKASAKKGNGQAIYALMSNPFIYKSSLELSDAADKGSIDAFSDLMENISENMQEVKFSNTSKVENISDITIFARIDCLVYLYTLMERLNLEKYSEVGLYVTHLSSETDSGYGGDYVTIDKVKYELCDHEHVIGINSRAYDWRIGVGFDQKFYEMLKIIEKPPLLPLL